MADVKRKTRTALDNELREKSVIDLMEMYSAKGEEILRVGGNVIAFPTVDSDGNEAWVEITVKIPKGERLGKGEGFGGYDGYEQAEFYKQETERKAQEAAAKKAAAEAKKAAAEAKKAKKGKAE
jgi:hypothetical protein